ncbi:MAG: transcription repressor NadR, partial [Oscillospiraceae bacterium]|nr:transcription repressor NadR [Oscillospiraceae bacterium]
MNAETRRKKILEQLSASDKPVSATALAKMFSVSRQVIVGDIALLRASGADITATPRGYVLSKEAVGHTRTVAVQHSPQQTKQELCIFVDNGCTVEDVIVEHPIYGQIVGQLHL